MKQVIDTGLPASRSPLEWATMANGVLFTAQIPIDSEGKVVDGGIDIQAKQTLDNLKMSVEAAGGTMADITQVLIYVTHADYLKPVNEIYAQYFEAPFPNRAAMVISALARPDMFVEIIAYAHIENEQRVA